jgi:hypothetical protein
MKPSVALVTSAVVALSARGASAGPKQLKGEFLCGTYVDGKVKKAITSGKVGKLTDPIACAFHLADAAEPSHAVHVRTAHAGKEIVTFTGIVNEDGDKKDFEIVLKPNDAFKPCEDFEISVGIFDPGGQFSKTIKVQQRCPKPSPINAELTCVTAYGDGTPIRLPPTKKLKGRIEKPIDCIVYARKVPADVKLTGAIWVKDKTRHTDALTDTAPAGQKMDASLQPDSDFEVCSGKFVVLASLVDADGAQRWTGKLDVPAQFCPD